MIGFNGGLIGADRTTTIGTAIGVWTPGEQIKAKRGGVWPLVGLAFRYFRWTITANRAVGSGVSTLTSASEFRIRNGAADVSMASATIAATTIVDSGGTPIANLIDGSVDTKMISINETLPRSVTIDIGSLVACTGYRWFTSETTGRDPVSWTVEGSADNTTYILLDTKTSFATTTTRKAEVGPFIFD
jgi:hypothetical protein